MENSYVGLFDHSDVKIVSCIVNNFIRKYGIFFGSLAYEDLMQECFFYVNEQKKKYLRKALSVGMTSKAFLMKSCYNRLNRILRENSSYGRGEAAIDQKDFGDVNCEGFNDAGDLNYIENVSSRGLFSDILSDLLLKEACLRVYASLNDVGRKVFILMVNENLNGAAMSKRLGISAGYACTMRKVVRDKARCVFL